MSAETRDKGIAHGGVQGYLISGQGSPLEYTTRRRTDAVVEFFRDFLFLNLQPTDMPNHQPLNNYGRPRIVVPEYLLT